MIPHICPTPMNPKNSSQVNWLKNIGSLFAFRVLEYIVPLITFPIVVRILGPDIYGKWVYTQTVVGFFSLAANLGLINYGQRQIAAYQETAKELIPSLLSMRVFLSILTYAILVGTLFFFQTDHTTQWLILIYGFTLVMNSIYNLDWILSGLQRFDKIAILQAVGQIISLGGIVLFLRRPETAWLLPSLVCIGTFLAGLWGWRWLRQEGIRMRIALSFAKWWKILRVSLYYSFASFMSLIYVKADHLILSWLKGDHALGEYGACYRLMGAFMGFVMIGTSVFVPYAAKISAKEPKRFGQVIRKGLLVLMAISLPMAVAGIVFSRDIVLLILGEQYRGSADLFRVLATIIPLGALSSFFSGALLFAPGHHRRYAFTVSMGAIVNMVGNVLLIPSWGGMGAAIATALAQGTVALWAIYLGHQYLSKVFSRSLLHSFAATAALYALLSFFVEAPFVLRLLAGGGIYVLVHWVLDRKDGRELSHLLSTSKWRHAPGLIP
jgi:O-antigen/teichoic acid export membrane protein